MCESQSDSTPLMFVYWFWTIKRIEQGTYPPLTPRAARRIAVALGVPAASLNVPPDPPVPQPSEAVKWEPVRLAVAGQHGPGPGEPPDLVVFHASPFAPDAPPTPTPNSAARPRLARVSGRTGRIAWDVPLGDQPAQDHRRLVVFSPFLDGALELCQHLIEPDLIRAGERRRNDPRAGHHPEVDVAHRRDALIEHEAALDERLEGEPVDERRRIGLSSRAHRSPFRS